MARGVEDFLPRVMASRGKRLTPAAITLERPIARGGMGSVWRAYDRVLGAHVAVKLMSPALLGDVSARARFVREARLAAKVRSPYVVQIHGLGMRGIAAIAGEFGGEEVGGALDETRGALYLVMELLEGEDLQARIARDGCLSMDDTSALVVQMCHALEQAHAENVVHRDIKPENIYLVKGNEFAVKLLDFGVAKEARGASRAMTPTGATIGTPQSMSPEQVFGSKWVDARCDLWALAVVAYTALVARAPFDGDTFGAVCIAIDRAKYIPPAELRPELGPAIDEWFRTAFRRDIARRFPTARAMREAWLTAVRRDRRRDVPQSPRTSRSRAGLGALILSSACTATVALAFAAAPHDPDETRARAVVGDIDAALGDLADAPARQIENGYADACVDVAIRFPGSTPPPPDAEPAVVRKSSASGER